jgi:hypothetical protein
VAVIHPRYVYVHVPKCGGNSVSQALGGVTPDVPMHLPRKALPLDRPAFGFLRDPWHRMVSLYYFLWQSPRKHLQRVDPVAVREMGFKRWLLEGENWMSNEPQPDGMVHTRQARSYSSHNWYPGLEIVAADKDLPPQQRRPVLWYLTGCDYIGRVETMQADLDHFMREIGQPRVLIGELNKTKAKPNDWRAEYDSETIAHVAHYFAPDIEAGGYEAPF